MAKEARNSISPYCGEECHAYCCRKGQLLLIAQEATTIMREKRTDALTTTSDGRRCLDLGKQNCPQLDGTSCKIHNHENRPQTCKDYPLFIEGKTIRLSPRCPAVQAGKFYAYEKAFMKAGYALQSSEVSSTDSSCRRKTSSTDALVKRTE